MNDILFRLTHKIVKHRSIEKKNLWLTHLISESLCARFGWFCVSKRNRQVPSAEMSLSVCCNLRLVLFVWVGLSIIASRQTSRHQLVSTARRTWDSLLLLILNMFYVYLSCPSFIYKGSNIYIYSQNNRMPRHQTPPFWLQCSLEVD